MPKLARKVIQIKTMYGFDNVNNSLEFRSNQMGSDEKKGQGEGINRDFIMGK